MAYDFGIKGYREDGTKGWWHSMFQVGDYIIYGTRGVCLVKNIGTLDFSGASKEKMYYTLEPCYMAGSTVYTPVDSEGITIRPIMSREEALALIDSIPDIEELWIKDEKSREYAYKEAIKGCDNRELVRIIKTIYQRGRSRMAEGKKATVADNKYFKIAEENLYGELALSLGMSKDEAKDFVVARVKEAVKKV